MFVVRNLEWNKNAESFYFDISMQSREEFRPRSCAISCGVLLERPNCFVFTCECAAPHKYFDRLVQM